MNFSDQRGSRWTVAAGRLLVSKLIVSRRTADIVIVVACKVFGSGSGARKHVDRRSANFNIASPGRPRLCGKVIGEAPIVAKPCFNCYQLQKGVAICK